MPVTSHTTVQIGCVLEILDRCTKGWSDAPGSDFWLHMTCPLFSVIAVTLT